MPQLDEARPQGQVRPACILVAEDNIQLRDFLSVALSAVGYRVVTASDGLAGIERFLDRGADLVLTDYEMPVMDGDRLAMAVKVLAPHVPVVMMSGVRDGRMVSPSVDCFIGKPFDLAQLMATVSSILARWLHLRPQAGSRPYLPSR